MFSLKGIKSSLSLNLFSKPNISSTTPPQDPPSWIPTDVAVLRRLFSGIKNVNQLSPQVYQEIRTSLVQMNGPASQQPSDEELYEWWLEHAIKNIGDSSADPNTSEPVEDDSAFESEDNEEAIPPEFSLRYYELKAHELWAHESGKNFASLAAHECARLKIPVKDNMLNERKKLIMAGFEELAQDVQERYIERTKNGESAPRKKRTADRSIGWAMRRHKNDMLEVQRDTFMASFIVVWTPSGRKLGPRVMHDAAPEGHVGFFEWLERDEDAKAAFEEILVEYGNAIGVAPHEPKQGKKRNVPDNPDDYREVLPLVFSDEMSFEEVRNLLRITMKQRYYSSGKKRDISWTTIAGNLDVYFENKTFPKDWSFLDPSRITKERGLAMLAFLQAGDEGRLSAEETIRFIEGPDPILKSGKRQRKSTEPSVPRKSYSKPAASSKPREQSRRKPQYDNNIKGDQENIKTLNQSADPSDDEQGTKTKSSGNSRDTTTLEPPQGVSSTGHKDTRTPERRNSEPADDYRPKLRRRKNDNFQPPPPPVSSATSSPRQKRKGEPLNKPSTNKRRK
ncbi:hypothetical protein CPB86DRAFT_783602 [Serendipita vermifera]|nr:hypothetical protein CPB86DRAFT_783602 [Serendipita vermifera]